MIDNIIKITSITFCSIYLLAKTSKNSLFIALSKIKYLCLFLLLNVTSIILNVTIKEFTYIIPIIILWIIISFLSNQPKLAFIMTTISFALSIVTHFLISFIITIILYILFFDKINFPYVILSIISTLLHFFSIYFFCKINRFKKGMPFLKQYNQLNFATVFSITLFMSLVYFIKCNSSFEMQFLLFSIITFTLAFLIFWWQAQIKKTYLRRLELQELESLRTEVNELNLVIRQLTEDNEKLSRITHRDNTLINALQDSTIKYLETDFESPTDASIAREKLIRNINTLSTERAGLISSLRKKSKREFDTGLTLLDELLRHMDAKATENNISFSVHLGILLTSFVPKDISEADLVHTVDDLLKNAFKSTMACEKRVVQLQFYKLGKHFVVEVADNGIPFEIHSLTSMGLERLTTYDDGTGIGLMDIWETKEKYRATYHLDEYASATLFTKKISLTFDKKNRYSIRTWRKNEILQMSRRIDLQIYSENE